MDDAHSLGKKGKMLTVAVLTIMIVLSLAAVTPANDAEATGGDCGDNLHWKVTEIEEEVVLEIYGNGNMQDFSSADDVPWKSYRTTVTKIVLTDDLTSIGSYAFKGFTNVTDPFEINPLVNIIGTQALANSAFSSIEVDESNNNFSSDSTGVLYDLSMTRIIQMSAGTIVSTYVTPATVKTIDPYAFMGCSFNELDIASSVTKLETNSLADIEIGSIVFGTSFPGSVTGCGILFYKTDEITEATVLKGLKFNLKNGNMVQNSSIPATYQVSFTECQEITAIEEVKGLPVTLPTGAVHLTKNLTFVGWLDSKDKPVGLWVQSTEDVVLKAKWNTKITFDSQGGTSVDPILGEPASTVDKPEDPTKKGLTFQKWVHVEPDLSETDVVWPVTLNENVTFKAVWKVQVTFDSQGGNDIPPAMIEKGSKINELPEPTKSGYAFVGWYDALESGTEVTSDYVFNESITVYAKWLAGAYKIRFICDIKGYPPQIIKSETVAGGAVITVPDQTTVVVDNVTYYIESWKNYTEGMTATKDQDFYGECVIAINITKSIDGSQKVYIDSNAVYILTNSFKKLTEKAKADPEFTYTVILENGEITFNSEFLKNVKAKDTKVAINKLSLDDKDLPEKVKQAASGGSELYRVIFGNETSLSSQLTFKLNHTLTGKQVEERVCIYSISTDGMTSTKLDGSPDSTGITFKAKSLDYFSIKYDTTSVLIKYSNENKPYQYYLVEYGKEVPVPQTTPTKEPTAMYVYVFKGWSGYVEGMKAFVDQEFKASFETELRLYTVKFVAEAQGERVDVEVQKLGYGVKITPPAKKSVDIGGKSYEIISYEGLSSETVVTSDVTFTAVLKEAMSTSWVYIVVCLAAVLIIVEGIYLYNKKYRD